MNYAAFEQVTCTCLFLSATFVRSHLGVVYVPIEGEIVQSIFWRFPAAAAAVQQQSSNVHITS